MVLKTGCFVTKRNMTERVGSEQIIMKNITDVGIITKQYTAKELNVSIGERLIGLEELNGWVWCEKQVVRMAGYQRKTYKNISNTIWLLI